MLLDSADVRYLLDKKGYNYADVARDLHITRMTVQKAVTGVSPSKRILSHIEQLLEIEPGTLVISKRQRPPLIKVA